MRRPIEREIDRSRARCRVLQKLAVVRGHWEGDKGTAYREMSWLGSPRLRAPASKLVPQATHSDKTLYHFP